jgi:23S rRNA A2030 N6-methylase RlmJ
MTYDHNRKAGNAGDVFKHVALVAALNSASKSPKKFRFVDLFAGYAFNPVVEGNEWCDGIGRVSAKPENVHNKSVRLYLKWYLSRPSLRGGMYPGSSLIAHDVLAHQGRKIELTLYDVSDKPIENLRLVYDSQNHNIHHRAATIKDPEIFDADFLFIDPPGLFSEHETSYPKLNELIRFTTLPRQGQVLFWLPLTHSIQADTASIQSLVENGFDITRTVWARNASTPGCVLAYKLGDSALQQLRLAVEEIYSMADFGDGKGALLEHIDA